MPCSKEQTAATDADTSGASSSSAQPVTWSWAVLGSAMASGSPSTHTHEWEAEWKKARGSMVKGHSRDIVPLVPSQASCVWERYYGVYSYVTGAAGLFLCSQPSTCKSAHLGFTARASSAAQWWVRSCCQHPLTSGSVFVGMPEHCGSL